MPISIQRAALLFALAKSEEQGGKEVAVGFNLSVEEGFVIGIGINENLAIDPNDSQSGIINLLQGIKSEAGKYVNFVATSMEPTIKSIGMAKMQGVKRIFYLGNEGLFMSINCDKVPSRTNVYDPESSGVTTIELSVINLMPSEKTKAKKWYDEIVKQFSLNTEKIKETETNLTKRFLGSLQKAKEYSRFGGLVLELPSNFIPILGGRVDTDLRHDIFMQLAWAIVGEASTRRGDPPLYPPGHNIGSVLRGPSDEILAWGINTNEGNPTLHGELNLIQNYHKNSAIKTLDSNAILYSTLEPCHMCAAMFAESGVNLKCFFGQEDPGIKENALKKKELGSSQNLRLVGLGKITTSALASQLKIFEHNKDNESKAITDLLNMTIKPLIQHAIYFYFDLGKTLHPISPEKTIWENGYKLLEKINPDVRAKREGYGPPL